MHPYRSSYLIEFLCIALLCFNLSAKGQASYSHVYATGSYTNLIGSTSLNIGQLWDDPEYHIAIGFTWEFFDQTYDSIYISDFVWFDQSVKYWISAYDSDFIDRGTSTSLSNISYLLSGTVGSQILKIEWNNAGFYDDITFNDFINVQLWLYEGTNRIEIHIGPNSVVNPDSYGGLEGGIIAVVDFISPEEIYLTGPPASPIIVFGFTEINGTPVDGSIYNFTKCINPQAQFTYAVDSNLTTTFTSNTPLANFFLWDFGDGSTSLLSNPTHTYADTGQYFASFAVSNNCDTNVLLTLICIYPEAQITADISASPIVEFNTLTTNAVSYYWDFGDGSNDSGKAQTHTYAQPGSYTVILVVDYGCGPDSIFKTISTVLVGIDDLTIEPNVLIDIYPNPVSDFIALKSTNPDGHLVIRIVDLAGQEMIRPFNLSSSVTLKVDVSKLKQGAYMVLATDGKIVSGRKLIKL